MSALNPNHPMSQLGAEHAFKFLACMIWKLRAHCPNLAIELTLKDMEEVATVFAGQRAIVALIGKPSSIILQLVDEASGRALITSANDENSPNARMMARCIDARKHAPDVAKKLLAGDRAPDLLAQAAEILTLLTWEPTE